MSELKTYRQVLNEFAQAVVDDAKANLSAWHTINGKRRRRIATGNLRDSLSYRLWKRGKNDVVIFTTTSKKIRDYADVIEEGRRPDSTPPPYGRILEWMKVKKIKLRNVDAENLMKRSQYIKGGEFKLKKTKKGKTITENQLYTRAAIRIAKAIGKNGIVGIHYFKDAIDNTFDDYKDKIANAIRIDIEKQLKEDKYIQ